MGIKNRFINNTIELETYKNMPPNLLKIRRNPYLSKEFLTFLKSSITIHINFLA